jgi:hypothetical protein
MLKLNFFSLFFQFSKLILNTEMATAKGYTARRYGVEGARFRGFDVDNLFPAGTNANMFYYQTNTLGLLRFHLHRAMLSGILEVVGWYDGLSGNSKQLIDNALKAQSATLSEDIWKLTKRLLRAVPTSLKMFPDSTLDSSLSGSSMTLEQFSKKFESMKLPDSVATVFTYQPRVAPPLPDEPVQVTLANGKVITPDPITVKEWKKKELLERKRQASYEEQELARLINDATKFIIWSTQISTNSLTIYERSGYLARNINQLAKAAQAKIAKLQLKSAKGNDTVGIFVNGDEEEDIEEIKRENQVVMMDESTENRHTKNSTTNCCLPSNQPVQPKKKKTLGKLMTISQNGINELYQTNDNSPADEFNGLKVVIMSQKRDLKHSLVNGVRQLLDSAQEEVIKLTNLDDEYISKHISGHMMGIPIKPELFILFGKAESTDGFPVYALKNTVIVRPSFHANWMSPQLEEYAAALEIWSAWDSQDSVHEKQA